MGPLKKKILSIYQKIAMIIMYKSIFMTVFEETEINFTLLKTLCTVRVPISLADIEIHFQDSCQMMGKLST